MVLFQRGFVSVSCRNQRCLLICNNFRSFSVVPKLTQRFLNFNRDPGTSASHGHLPLRWSYLRNMLTAYFYWHLFWQLVCTQQWNENVLWKSKYLLLSFSSPFTASRKSISISIFFEKFPAYYFCLFIFSVLIAFYTYVYTHAHTYAGTE